MKRLSLNFNKNAIFGEVSLASAYAGAKYGASPGEAFDRIAAAKADADLLERFRIEMSGVISDKLKNLIVSQTLDEQGFQLELELSGAYDESLNASVEADLCGAYSAGITARWFRYAFPERAAEWTAESESLLERAFHKLCYRKKPVRNEHDAENR